MNGIDYEIAEVRLNYDGTYTLTALSAKSCIFLEIDYLSIKKFMDAYNITSSGNLASQLITYFSDVELIDIGCETFMLPVMPITP